MSQPPGSSARTSGDARAVGQVTVGRRVEDGEVRPRARAPGGRRRGRRSAAAPPAVAAHSASAGVIRISRTASAMQNGIDEVKQLPGLQSVASATVTPASSRRRASG